MEQLATEYLVERPALLRRLDGALSLPVTLLVAQAGAGKTVLLSQWADRHKGVAVVWIDIEPADGDPVRFARRLLPALAAVQPEIAELTRLTALNAGGLGEPLLQALATAFESFPETVIVLDDVHHLGNRTLLADLGRLVSMLPSNVHVVFSTRVDPAISWSGLRLRNHLLEIRQSDLAMSEPESAELLAKVTRGAVTSEMSDALMRRTEGWAAGLQLAGLALRFHERPDEFVAEFRGTDRLIAEYLTEEVLDAIPDGSRAVLLRMSSLDSMSGELIDHVLERADGRRLLERLEQESVFLVAIDSSRESFRFHQLFRDLLRSRLRAERPDEERRLLQRAADFHGRRGERAPSIEYLLRARDWSRALDAIMARGSDVFERGEMRTVVRWITAIPEAARDDRRDVTLELGILVGMQGDAARAVDTMSAVADDPRSTIGQRMVAHAWTSATAQWNTRPEESIHAAERAIELLDEHPDVSPPDLMHLTTPRLLRTLAAGSGGRAHFLAGDLTEAEAWMLRAMASDGISYPPFRVDVLGSLALLHSWRGRTMEADLVAAEALEVAGETGLLTHPVIADAHLAMAMTAHERGVPDAAATPLRDGTVHAWANHRTQLAWISRTQHALIAASDGRFDEALRLADLSEHDAMSAPAPVILDRLIAVHMYVLRRTGRASEALRLGANGSARLAATAFERVAAALTLRDRRTADRMLDEASTVFDAEAPRSDIRRLLLQAWGAELRDDHRTALDLADDALNRAEPGHLVEVFLETDPLVIRLVAELAAVRHCTLSTAILRRQRLLESPDANALLPEPLTERELEVLSYLPDHSTTAELARLCFVSVNTLKTHLAHIYRKLGVSGRSAAIARGRELGLLGAAGPVGAIGTVGAVDVMESARG